MSFAAGTAVLGALSSFRHQGVCNVAFVTLIGRCVGILGTPFDALEDVAKDASIRSLH